MEFDEKTLVEYFRRELKRKAWRLQYAAKQRRNREVLFPEEHYLSSSFEKEVVSKIFIQELKNAIPSQTGQYIYKRTIVDGATEREVADELKMSQQAVNKWKKKIKYQLLKKIPHSQPYY
ncbi:sigma-70 family RNA polymerase sigma factor [Brevibacillus panacihumi]|uniref:sigma-70 family RNA polymerase sigma factor n=1 Tax=Brevibacillus panacihumi TaxID=497735 RepID=UPI003D222466